MRKWITLVESSNEASLEEGKFTNFMAAAALAGVGTQMAKTNAEEPTPISQMADENGWEIKYGYDDSDSPPKTIPSAKSAFATKEKAKTSAQAPKMDEATKLLALTIWGEARNGGPEAMRAVGHVIINRINSTRNFGNTIKRVVWKRKAFSCWNKGDPNREAMKRIAKMDDKNLDKIRWKQAIAVAKKIMRGNDPDPTGGSLFYHTKEISPVWSKDQKVVASIHGHVFYKNDAKAKPKPKEA